MRSQHPDGSLCAPYQPVRVGRQYDVKKTARTSTTTESPAPGVPDVVGVVMGEIAADVQEGLLAIAVGAGL
jgi:hypothetical protein